MSRAMLAASIVRAIVLIPERHEFDRATALEILLTGLVNLNVALMRHCAEHGHPLPALYNSGVRYKIDRAIWRNALDVLKTRAADCKSLSAYRAAELILAGHDAKVVVHRTSPSTLHARVCVDNRWIDDPSRKLGMRAGTGKGFHAQRALKPNAINRMVA